MVEYLSTEMDLDVANVVRLITLLVLIWVAFEMLLMLSHYWHAVIPLRREVGEGRIMAPPVGWTFAYHVVVFCWVVSMVVIRLQAALDNYPVNASTFYSIPLSVALLVVVRKFQKYYMRNLFRASRVASAEGGRPVRANDPPAKG